MFGAILKATNSSFQKGRTFCRSIYVKKVMKLLAFIFEQPSYIYNFSKHACRLNLCGWGDIVSSENTALISFLCIKNESSSIIFISRGHNFFYPYPSAICL